MTPTVLDAKNYVSYLRDALGALANPRGRRADLARFLGCQTSFISQILTDRAHLSREQAIKVAGYLDLGPDERRCFMLLVDRDRSGTTQLRDFYQQEIDAIVLRREEVKERIGVADKVPDEAHYTYYGSWIYAAIHVLSALPSTPTAQAIAIHLRLPLERVEPVIDWLVRQGLIHRRDDRLSIGHGRVHLGAHSPLVARHHANWRLKALEHLDRPTSEDLHYSAVLGISREATVQLKSWLLKFLQDAEPLIGAAPEERATVLLLDLFEL